MMTVKRGMYGTSMPGWDRILPDDEIADVVRYIKTLAPQFARAAAAGGDRRRHSELGRQHRARPAGLRQAAVRQMPRHRRPRHGRRRHRRSKTNARQPLRAADLTEPWTFRGGATSRDVYIRFRTGMIGHPDAVVRRRRDGRRDVGPRQLRRLARAQAGVVDDGRAGRRRSMRSWMPTRKANPVRRGQYLVETLGCAMCHSPYDEQKRVLPGHGARRRPAHPRRAVWRLPHRQSHVGQGHRSRRLDRR